MRNQQRTLELKLNLAFAVRSGAELLHQRLAIWQSNPISCDPRWFILGWGFKPQRGCHVGDYVIGLCWATNFIPKSLWIFGAKFWAMLKPSWARLGGGKQPQPKLVGLGLDWAPFWVYAAATLRLFVGPIWWPNRFLRERMLLQHCSCVTVSGSLILALLARRAKAKLLQI